MMIMIIMMMMIMVVTRLSFSGTSFRSSSLPDPFSREALQPAADYIMVTLIKMMIVMTTLMPMNMVIIMVMTMLMTMIMKMVIMMMKTGASQDLRPLTHVGNHLWFGTGRARYNGGTAGGIQQDGFVCNFYSNSSLQTLRWCDICV